MNIEVIRNQVLAYQAVKRSWNMCDPVSIKASLEKCPAGTSLAMLWAHHVVGIMEGMLFVTEPDETMVGRVRFAERPAEETAAAQAWLNEQSPLRGCNGRGQTGHCEPYYDDLFAIGIDGLLARLEDLRSKATPGSEQADTYDCFLYVMRGFSALIERAAEYAGNGEARERCLHVAHKPPRTFREAIQLMWFVCLCIQLADSAALVGPGRIDLRLGSYYERDKAEGKITYEEAVKDIALLYVYINDFCPRGLAYPVMLGGLVHNELSYAGVDAVRHSRLVYPSVGLCVNEQTPVDLKRLFIDVIAEGYPNPAFFNDRVIRGGLEHYGVPAEVSGQYINSTCVEITPSGASYVWVASPYFNLCGALLELLDGEYDSFEAFLQAYFEHLGKKVDDGAANENAMRRERNEKRRRPMQSLFTNDCIAKGLDIERGGAKYNWVECSFVGLGNWVDSMAVIREEVFRKKLVTLKELGEILKGNFEGCEAYRQKLLHAYPKYGHADKETDALVAQLVEAIKGHCSRQKMFPGDTLFIPGTFCWEMHQKLGAATGATPDGRVAGFPFADGAGPAQGREKYGPTAAVQSVCSWCHRELIGGTAFNMRFSKSILGTDDARDKLLALVDVFIAGGGFETQINVADNSLLKKALVHPEEYADLVVRIGGYTDYFVKLSPQMQQEILMRTEYESL